MQKIINTEVRVATWLTVLLLVVVIAGVAWHEHQWNQRVGRLESRVSTLAVQSEFIVGTGYMRRSDADSLRTLLDDRIDSLEAVVASIRSGRSR
jgi:hypothetical protein